MRVNRTAVERRMMYYCSRDGMLLERRFVSETKFRRLADDWRQRGDRNIYRCLMVQRFEVIQCSQGTQRMVRKDWKYVTGDDWS